MGLTRALAFSERLGQNLWRRIQPSTRAISASAHLITQAFRSACYGAGCLRLVYSALATALTAGSASKGRC